MRRTERPDDATTNPLYAVKLIGGRAVPTQAAIDAADRAAEEAAARRSPDGEQPADIADDSGDHQRQGDDPDQEADRGDQIDGSIPGLSGAPADRPDRREAETTGVAA